MGASILQPPASPSPFLPLPLSLFLICQSFCLAVADHSVTWVLWSETPCVILLYHSLHSFCTHPHTLHSFDLQLSLQFYKYQCGFCVCCKVSLSQQLSVCGIWSNCISTKNSFIFNERPPTLPSPHALPGCFSSDTCWSIWMFWEERVHIRLTTVTFICAWQYSSNCMSNTSHSFFSSNRRVKVCQCTMLFLFWFPVAD